MIDAKNALLIAVVLFVAALIGLYIPYQQYQKSQSALVQNATSTPGGTHVTILYTNKGFEPDTITVKVGTTVEWSNESDMLMWVASDPHPSHTDLPGFDERGTQGNDAKTSPRWVPTAYAHTQSAHYSYTFLKVGRWGYHNHLNPFDRGVVIVE